MTFSRLNYQWSKLNIIFIVVALRFYYVRIYAQIGTDEFKLLLNSEINHPFDITTFEPGLSFFKRQHFIW